MRHRLIIGTLALALGNHVCFALQQYAISNRGSQSRGIKQRRHEEPRHFALNDDATDDGNVDAFLPSSTDDDRDDDAARSGRSIGQAKRRLERATRREDRVHQLEAAAGARSDAEDAELAGLLRVRGRDDDSNFEERYDPNSFAPGHAEFKRLHNEAFVALARYCQRERYDANRGGGNDIDDIDDDDENSDEARDGIGDPNVFYLDGPDASTSSLLIDVHGFDPRSCYVANRHASTCDVLRRMLPPENLIHASAAEALMPPNGRSRDDRDDATAVVVVDVDGSTSAAAPSFSDVDFAAYYFDGCGGFPPHVVDMMSAALVRPAEGGLGRRRGGVARAHRGSRTTAVGYSLMGGNRDVVGKELDVCRALASIARANGMRTRHVLDDPVRYGLPMDIVKTEGGTFTSWMLLECVGSD